MSLRALIPGSLLLLVMACESVPDYDIIIRSGRVVDGTGTVPREADVAIRDGVIEGVGDLAGSSAARVIDAAGRVVTPGFIDLMGGSSLPLLRDPVTADSKLRQGITTMMVGEGASLAPQNERTFQDVDAGGMRWERYREYFEILQDHGIVLNLVHNVGAAQVRRIVLGDEDVAATPLPSSGWRTGVVSSRA